MFRHLSGHPLVQSSEHIEVSFIKFFTSSLLFEGELILFPCLNDQEIRWTLLLSIYLFLILLEADLSSLTGWDIEPHLSTLSFIALMISWLH